MARRISSQGLRAIALMVVVIGLLQVGRLCAQSQQVIEYGIKKIGSQVAGLASNDGEVYVLATSSFGGHVAPTIEKLDSNGTMLWKQFLISDPVMTHPLICLSASSDLICVGMLGSYDSRIVIYKLDALGRVRKAICDSIGGYVTVNQVIRLSDGSFALIGTSGSSTIIARYDSSLSLQWMKTYTVAATSYLHTPMISEGKNSEIIVVESFSDALGFIFFTSTGEIDKKVFYDFKGKNIDLTSFRLHSNGALFVYGTIRGVSVSDDALLIKCTSDGTITNAWTYPVFTSTIAGTMSESAQGDLLIASTIGTSSGIGGGRVSNYLYNRDVINIRLWIRASSGVRL